MASHEQDYSSSKQPRALINSCLHLVFKGARSRCFRNVCLILLVMRSKGQIGRARVFHLQNHDHITTESSLTDILIQTDINLK